MKEIPNVQPGEYAHNAPRYRRCNAHLHEMVAEAPLIGWRHGSLRLVLGHVLTVGARAKRPLHRHDHWELAFVLEGLVHYEVGDQVVSVGPSEAFLMPANIPHRWAAQRAKNVILGFFLDVDAPEDRAASLRRRWVDLGHRLTLPEEIQATRAQLLKAATASRLQWPLVYPLLHALMVQIAEASSTEGAEGIGDRQGEYIRRATAYIESNLEQALRVKDIAEHVGIGERQLNRVFHERLGHSVQDILLQHRLTRARTQLRQGYSAKYTAISSGFSSTSYFTRCFKAHVGMTPGKYRKGKEG